MEVAVSKRSNTRLPRSCRLDVPEMQAAASAYARVFGAEPVFSREGGSIPIATVVQEANSAFPILFMGFGLPDDNLHAPNEKLHLPNLLSWHSRWHCVDGRVDFRLDFNSKTVQIWSPPDMRRELFLPDS